MAPLNVRVERRADDVSLQALIPPAFAATRV